MQIFFSNHFKKQIKKLQNKFPHVKHDLLERLNNFSETKEIHIGKSIYKIRIKSRDLNKGKSGGLRSYIYILRKNNALVPLCIYLKSTQANLGQQELKIHFDKTAEEIFRHFVN